MQQEMNVFSKKGRKICAALRTAVWNKYIGEEAGVSKCYTGCKSTISQSNFQCGHVIAHSKGGATDVNNLRPVCQRCNTSMGAMNMFDFMNKCGFTVNSTLASTTMYPNLHQLFKDYAIK